MRNFVGRLFIRYWVSEEEWFWTFQPFSKLETTFYKYWTSIKSLIHPFKSLLPLNSTSWIMFKRHICERKFHVSYHFFRYLWGLRRTNFINPSCSKHPKITKIKNDKFLFQHFFLVPQKRFMKAFYKVTRRVKTVFLSNSRLMSFAFP